MKNKFVVLIVEKFPQFILCVFSVYIAITIIMNVVLNNRIYTYYKSNNLNLPSGIWLMCSIALLVLILFILNIKKMRKIVLFEKQFYRLIIISFIIIYFIQLFISKNIYFKTGWDVAVLRNDAENIAFNGANGVEPNYFNWYPNNVFTVYVLVLFYKFANIVHSQNPYVVVVAINNLLVNVSIMMATLSIYKLTKKQKITIISMGMGVILIGLSPWIVIPYTDTLGMIFPIGAIFCYVFVPNKYLRCFLFTGICGIGYLYKPTVIIVFIAFLIISIFAGATMLLRHTLKVKKVIKIGACIIVAMLVVVTLDKVVLSMNKTNLDENKSMTITHYFMMGLNEDTEGVYNEDDVNYSKSFEDKATRQEGNIQVIKQRLQKMGVFGYITQLAKKNLSNYNDGTFAWAREGNFFMEIPEKNEVVATFLRKFYYWYGAGQENYYQIFAAIEQVIWFLVLICCVGCILPQKRINNVEGLIALTLIGVSLFLLLFECRARYLYIFSPLYISLAGVGLDRINCFLHELGKKSDKKENESNY